MDSRVVFEELFQKRRGDIRPGVERVVAAYQQLGCPAKNIPKVVVGGTNGKGSTLAFFVRLLEQQGLKIGAYSSPHIQSIAERYWVTSHRPTETELMHLTIDLRNKLDSELWGQLSFFEIAVLLGLRLFEARGVDLIALEVGLGGRWDATNIFEPVATAITSIGLDHQEYLGDSLAAILTEKLGINRRDVPFVWGGQRDIEGDNSAEHVLHSHLETVCPQLIAVEKAQQQPVLASYLTDFCKRMPSYLQHNLSVAASLAEVTLNRLGKSSYCLTEASMSTDLSEYMPTLIGRFNYLTVARNAKDDSRMVLVDVCHNEPGAKAFVRGVRCSTQFGQKPVIKLVSILKDKNYREIVSVLQSLPGPLIGFSCDDSRTWQKSDYEQTQAGEAFFSSFADAWQYVTMGLKLTACNIAICGSVSALGDIFEYFESGQEWEIESNRFI